MGLRDLDERLAPDDAPLWAEVAGMIVPAAVVMRGAIHVAVALLGRRLGKPVAPHLAGHGLQAASPVADLRGSAGDAAARLLVCLVGLSAWSLFAPAAPAGPVGARVWIGAQCIVLIIDPLLWLLDT